MKKSLTSVLIMFFLFNFLCSGQVPEFPPDSKPASTHAPGLEFPRMDSQSRAILRVEAPGAQKVQLAPGSVYDMVKGDDGVWAVTNKPLDPGFHYYFLIINDYCT